MIDSIQSIVSEIWTLKIPKDLSKKFYLMLNQGKVPLPCMLRSNGYILLLYRFSLRRRFRWISQIGRRSKIAPCILSNKSFWRLEVVPERWKVTYLVYTLSHEVESGLIGKDLQFAIFAIGSTARPWSPTSVQKVLSKVKRTHSKGYLKS